MKKLDVKSLPETLARRIQFLREQLGITQEELSKRTSLELEIIRDIESGVELFLSIVVRQKLATVLKTTPAVIKSVEYQPKVQLTSAQMEKEKSKLIEYIIIDPDACHTCLQCGEPLVVRLFERRDLENNLLVDVKAHCCKCLFRLQS